MKMRKIKSVGPIQSYISFIEFNDYRRIPLNQLYTLQMIRQIIALFTVRK